MFLLEKRMLSDASGLLGVVSALPQDESLSNASGIFEHTSNPATVVHVVTPELLVAAPNAVIFIESDVSNPNALIKNISNNITVVSLDPNQNGIKQITDWLSTHRKIDSVYILSHGNAGEIDLGQSINTNRDISNYSNELKSWSIALNPNADILLYGCSIASDKDGIDLVQTISHLTGANVAASTNATGSQLLGGDWVLEYQVGNIKSPLFNVGSELDSYDVIVFSRK